jgi:hypothetical protein
VDLTVTGAYASYAWSNGSTSATISVSPAATTTYTVTVTNAATCTTTANVTVTVNTIAPPNIPPVSTCNGGSATLTASTGYTSYLWSTGGTGQSITVSPTAGTSYTVTVTNSNGCTSTGTGTVSVNANPAPTIGGSTQFCIGSSTTLSAPAGFTTYAWTPSGSGSSITVNTPGTYSVVVTDANGCTGSASVNVTQNTSLSPAISGDLSLMCRRNLHVRCWRRFCLFMIGHRMQQMQLPQVSQSLPVRIVVTVTDAGGCTGATTVTVVAAPTPPVAITGDP